jgi:hypothetical protein
MSTVTTVAHAPCATSSGIHALVVEYGPQRLAEGDRHVDHRRDREAEAREVEVQVADRRGALVGVAYCEALREPEMDAPHRQRDDAHGGVDGETGPALLGGRIVEDEKQDGRAEVDQTQGKHHERRGAHDVEVQAPQGHARNRTTIPR